MSQLINSGSEVTGSDFAIILYDVAAIGLIAVSCIVVIVSFFGCCGAWRVRI